VAAPTHLSNSLRLEPIWLKTSDNVAARVTAYRALAQLMAASDEDQRNSKLACGGVLVLVGGIVMVAVAGTIYWIGPERFFETVLAFLPDHPGSKWAFGWTLFLCANSVLGMPIWSAVCVLTGFLFGRWLSVH